MVATSAEKVYVVTAASRGLGLGMVEGLLKQEHTVVVAAARNPDKAEALQKLASQYKGRVHLVALDTTDEAGIKVRTVIAALPWFRLRRLSVLLLQLSDTSWYTAITFSFSCSVLFCRLLLIRSTSCFLEALMCW